MGFDSSGCIGGGFGGTSCEERGVGGGRESFLNTHMREAKVQDINGQLHER